METEANGTTNTMARYYGKQVKETDYAKNLQLLNLATPESLTANTVEGIVMD